jgi:hypothetical protein
LCQVFGGSFNIKKKKTFLNLREFKFAFADLHKLFDVTNRNSQKGLFLGFCNNGKLFIVESARNTTIVKMLDLNSGFVKIIYNIH